MAVNCVFGFLVLVCYYFLLLSAENVMENHWKCPKSFNCGKLGKDVHYPFTNTRNPKCGLAIRGCDDPDADKEIQLEYNNQIWYKIERILQISSKSCSAFNHIMPLHILFRCNNTAHEKHSIYNCSDYDICSSSKLSDECSSALQLPIGPPSIFVDPFASSSELLIDVTLSNDSDPCFECCYAGRECLLGKQNISCVDANATENNKGDSEKVKIIGLSIGLAGMTIIALFVILLLYKRRHNSSSSQNQPRNIDSGPSSNINMLSGTVYFGVPVFSYEELQEATDNFDQARELGEGGFGTVYYGKLQDGREVAVKRLYERNYRPVESFINEIQILTRLRHTNLVSLYGCTSRHSRELLLVYEYIPNGTVSYHLHGDNAKPGLMPWPVRMKIAIETASALTYLHASDIIHRDVKTSNILLNNNFSVKVADFGLSRLFPTDVTHVSTAPRGTPGYVDPDYRICYQLTSKSDVYSFGVVLVELISSLPAIDMTRERGEIKLANLAIRKIQKGAFCELVDPSLGFQSDDKLKRMITSVAELAFQCLQGDKELRPSMGEVLEVLLRIESWKDVPGNQEGVDVNRARLSHSYAHPSLPNTLVKPHNLHQTL